MRNLAEISDHELLVAEWINAVDEQSTHWETLWGLDEQGTLPTAKPQRIVEIAIAQEDDVGLLNAVSRVEQVKGELSPRVQALREVLKQSTAMAIQAGPVQQQEEIPPFDPRD